MGAADIGYMIGAFVGALFLTGIIVALSRSIRASLTKLFITVLVLTVLAITASYYGNADGDPVVFPLPLDQFFGFEAVLRLASFGAAFLVFSVPVLSGYWRQPNQSVEDYGTANLRMSKLAIPIAIASFIPLIWHIYQNRPPESGLQLYQTIAPETYSLLLELDPSFQEKAEDAIGLHRLATNVLTPRTQADFAAEVGVVAQTVQELIEGRTEKVLRAPAEVQGEFSERWPKVLLGSRLINLTSA